MLSVLDLFSGIGGFTLGLERTGGFKTVAFCECEAFPRLVLARHWPEIPIYDDVRELTGERLTADGIDRVDVITAGFPCQDISLAGAGAGIRGERSGLFGEVARITGEIRPRYIVLENVSALLSRGLGALLGDLAEIGYDAEWYCIPASAIGAKHRRDRWWCIAYPKDMANTDRPRLEGWLFDWFSTSKQSTRTHGESIPGAWLIEPSMGRVANGIPKRVDRLKALGNSVVPQLPELIGNAILDYERAA